MAERKKSQKTNSGGLGCLFWLALFLLIVGLVLFNRSLIQNYLKEKGLFSSGDKTVQTAPARPEAPSEIPSAAQPSGNKPSPETQPQATAPKTDTDIPPVIPQQTLPEKTTEPQKAPLETVKKVQPAVTPVERPTKPSSTTISKPSSDAAKTVSRVMYLMKVESDGSISRSRSLRSLAVSDSPLADSLTALLQGPTAEDKKKGLSTLIPPGTRLISAIVRGTTAYLNFNDQFQYNSFGIEGYAAQLKQVVWTATEFSTVKDVQVLIEGRRVDYLGSEGIWIGSPISRASVK